MIRLLALALLLALGPAQAQLTLSGVGGGFGSSRGGPGAATGIVLVNNTGSCTSACGTGITTTTQALSGTHAGNLLVIGVGYCNNSCGTLGTVVVSSITSSNGGGEGGEACVQVPSAASPTSQKIATDVWYCKNIIGGTDTITVNFSAPGADFPNVYLTEWSGASTSAPLDDIGTGNVGATNSITLTTTAPTASSGELIYSPAISFNTLTPGNTGINNVSTGDQDEYQISGAIGSYSNTWSISGSTGWAASLAVFKQ